MNKYQYIKKKLGSSQLQVSRIGIIKVPVTQNLSKHHLKVCLKYHLRQLKQIEDFYYQQQKTSKFKTASIYKFY